MLKHYITFYMPGAFYPEDHTEEVESRDMPNSIPSTAFAFEFFDRTVVDVDGEQLKGRVKNISGRYYIDALLYKVSEVKAMDMDERQKTNLIFAATNNSDCGLVVKCKTGNWQPFMLKDYLFVNGGAVRADARV